MHLEDLRPLITWLSMHQHLSGLLIFLIAFIESIAVVSIFIPGSIIMTVFGILIGSGNLPFFSTIYLIILGSLAGDIISFWLGYRYHNHIRYLWPFSLVPSWFEKGETFFNNHGGKGIFVGRFLGPIRPMLPVIAGILRMPFIRFAVIDTLATIIWAPVYMLPGLIIGTASQSLPPRAATELVFGLIVILLVLWLGYWLIKRGILRLFRFIDNLFYNLWNWMQTSPTFKALSRTLHKGERPEDHTQLILLFITIIIFLLFVGLTIFTIKTGPLTWINIDIYHFFRSYFNQTLQHIMLFFTYMGDTTMLIPFWLFVLGWLSYYRKWYLAVHWIFLGCFAIGAAGVFKKLIYSPRPQGVMRYLSQNSFPSGHTTTGTAIFVFFALIISVGRSKSFYYIALISAFIISLLIGISRLYLELHWFTDVIGGFLLALILILGTFFFYRRERMQIVPALPKLLMWSVLVIGLGMGWLFYNDFPKDSRDLMPRWRTQVMDQNSWWEFGISPTPLYRTNRFGMPIQTLNLQWVGNLKDIENTLLINGWFKNPPGPLINTLGYFITKDKTQTFPLLHATYNDKPPVLIMAKVISPKEPLLILRLWASNVSLEHNSESIFVGVLNYRESPPKFLQLNKHHKEMTFQLPSAINVSIQNLQNTEWKILNFENYLPLNSHEDREWDGRVLLVKLKK